MTETPMGQPVCPLCGEFCNGVCRAKPPAPSESDTEDEAAAREWAEGRAKERHGPKALDGDGADAMICRLAVESDITAFLAGSRRGLATGRAEGPTPLREEMAAEHVSIDTGGNVTTQPYPGMVDTPETDIGTRMERMVLDFAERFDVEIDDVHELVQASVVLADGCPPGAVVELARCSTLLREGRTGGDAKGDPINAGTVAAESYLAGDTNASARRHFRQGWDDRGKWEGRTPNPSSVAKMTEFEIHGGGETAAEAKERRTKMAMVLPYKDVRTESLGAYPRNDLAIQVERN